MKNLIGIHALVWSGTWNVKDIENSIKLSKNLGYDLIEIPHHLGSQKPLDD